jgi:hypothetical protein
MIDFTSHSRIFHSYGDVTIASKRLQNLGLCSALRPLSSEGSLSCHTHCNTEPQFFRSHPKNRSHLVAFYEKQRDAEDLFYPGSSRVPIQSPLTMLRIYSNPDPHGSHIISHMCYHWHITIKDNPYSGLSNILGYQRIISSPAPRWTIDLYALGIIYDSWPNTSRLPTLHLSRIYWQSDFLNPLLIKNTRLQIMLSTVEFSTTFVPRVTIWNHYVFIILSRTELHVSFSGIL